MPQPHQPSVTNYGEADEQNSSMSILSEIAELAKLRYETKTKLRDRGESPSQSNLTNSPSHEPRAALSIMSTSPSSSYDTPSMSAFPMHNYHGNRPRDTLSRSISFDHWPVMSGVTPTADNDRQTGIAGDAQKAPSLTPHTQLKRMNSHPVTTTDFYLDSNKSSTDDSSDHLPNQGLAMEHSASDSGSPQSSQDTNLPVVAAKNEDRKQTSPNSSTVKPLTEVDRLMLLVQARDTSQRHNKKANSGEMLFKCTVEGCGKCFKQRAHLHTHLRSHSGERPYVCPYPDCHKFFSQRCNLRTHIRSHTGERPYKCSACGRAFSQQGNMRHHELIHFNDHPLVCKLNNCNKTFNQLGNLKAHHNAAHLKLVTNFAERLASEASLDDLPPDERVMFNYFCELYKNSNRGIKGRGKGTKTIAVQDHNASVNKLTPADSSKDHPVVPSASPLISPAQLLPGSQPPPHMTQRMPVPFDYDYSSGTSSQSRNQGENDLVYNAVQSPVPPVLYDSHAMARGVQFRPLTMKSDLAPSIQQHHAQINSNSLAENGHSNLPANNAAVNLGPPLSAQSNQPLYAPQLSTIDSSSYAMQPGMLPPQSHGFVPHAAITDQGCHDYADVRQPIGMTHQVNSAFANSQNTSPNGLVGSHSQYTSVPVLEATTTNSNVSYFPPQTHSQQIGLHHQQPYQNQQQSHYSSVDLPVNPNATLPNVHLRH